MNQPEKTKSVAIKIVAAVLVGAIGFGVWSWFGNRDLDKVSKLVDRLAVAGDLPKADRNALKLDLMRTVDELPGEKLNELYSQLRKKGAEHEKAKIQEFASASDGDKPALLDADLERQKNRGEVWRALRSDGMPYSSWGGNRRRRNRGDRGKGEKKGDKKAEKKELSEEEKAARSEYNKQRREYYTALKERAEELGMGKDRGKDDRRGNRRKREKKK